jgi:hypothetical protein
VFGLGVACLFFAPSCTAQREWDNWECMEAPQPAEPVLLREINERVADFARSHDDENAVYGFLCECGEPSCAEIVRLAVTAYVEWANQGLVVAEGHRP